jgi:PIN domain nuclease of toxin-antitoxin system
VKLLLDTHIWLWSLLAPAKLTRPVAAALENPGNELWLSPVSTWELLLLCHKRRVVLDADPAVWIENALKAAPFIEAPLTHEVALETARVRLPHRDPADAFLVATARVFELTLVTADERLIAARQVRVLANRPKNHRGP